MKPGLAGVPAARSTNSARFALGQGDLVEVDLGDRGEDGIEGHAGEGLVLEQGLGGLADGGPPKAHCEGIKCPDRNSYSC